MQEVGNAPAPRRGTRPTQIVGVHVRVDDRRGRGPELLQHRLVALDVPSRINHDGIAVAHEDVAQGTLADAIELHDVLERARR